MPANSPLMAFWRVKLAYGLISGFVLVLLPIAFLSALFLHSRQFAAAGIVILAVAMASNAVLETARIRLVFQLGRWSGWKGEPIWRKEHPARFWTRTVMHGTALAVYAGAAVFLMLLNLRWMTKL